MTINLTLTENQIYAGILMLLVLLQVYQQHQILKNKKEVKQVWDQLAMLVFTIGNRFAEIEGKQQAKQPDNNETKN